MQESILEYAKEMIILDATGLLQDLSYAIIGTTIPFSVSAITVFIGPLYLAELIMGVGFAYLIFIIPMIVVAYRIISLPRK